eukprot:scaffold2943_cov239-Pinguiococcus_pyrenoidosus.AAC.3
MSDVGYFPSSLNSFKFRCTGCNLVVMARGTHMLIDAWHAPPGILRQSVAEAGRVLRESAELAFGDKYLSERRRR